MQPEPQPIGLAPSFGFGDRIGLSTPGHVAALRRTGLAGKVVPIFAQQSIRELTRTNRRPEDVLAAARHAVRATGWDLGWGADADHLKTEQDVRRTVAAGFTFFTADPSDFVNESVVAEKGSGVFCAKHPAGPAGKRLPTPLPATFEAVCGNCGLDAAEYLDRFAGSSHVLGDFTLQIPPDEAMRVAIVYLPAIAHVVKIFEWITQGWSAPEPFDFEVSVDETEAPTTVAAHFIIADQLKRAGVRITSLAPRFVGDFEKAVDYRGDLATFEEDLIRHVAIARVAGPYKLSVHSGSDKFSIYPLLHRRAGDMLHVKTAGTSYLEALRLMARHRPALFRDVLRLAMKKFSDARATYHLSTNLEAVPAPDDVSDADMESAYLEPDSADDGRQVLHVAFGDVLRHGQFAPALGELLTAHADEHVDDLVKHFRKHLVAFGV